MGLREIINRLNQGHIEALDKITDPVLVELLEDAIYSSKEPNSTISKYESILSDELFQEDTNVDSSLERLGHRYYAIALLIKAKIALGDTVEMEILSLATDYLEDHILDREMAKLSEVDHFGIAQFLDKLFHFYWYKGNYPRCKYYGSLAIEFYNMMGYHDFEYLIRGNLAIIDRNFKPQETLLDEYYKIMDYYEQNDMLFNLFQMKFNTCDLHISRGEISRAFEIIQDSEQKLRDEKILNQLSPALRERVNELEVSLTRLKGLIFNSTGNYSASVKIFKELYEKYKNLYHDDRSRAGLLTHLGYAYYLNDEFEEARSCYTRARKIYDNIENENDIADLLFKIAILEIDDGTADISSLISQLEGLELASTQQIWTIKIQYLRIYMKYKSDQVLQRFEAISEFLDLLESPLPFYLELNIRTHIVKLQLIELSIVYNEQKVVEIEISLSKLKELAEINHVYPTLLEITMLMSTLKLFQEKHQEVFDVIALMEIKLKEENLDTLQQRLDAFRENIERMITGNMNPVRNKLFNHLINRYQDNTSEHIKSIDDYNLSTKRRLMDQREKPYDIIVDPTRLKIMKLLDIDDKLGKPRIAELTNIPYSTLNRHLKILTKESLITSSINLVGTRPTRVYSLTISGIKLLSALKADLVEH